ncbi:MAG: sulfatase [Thermoanaerobaculia bacterium]
MLDHPRTSGTLRFRLPALLVAVVAACSPPRPASREPDLRPDVVLILIDTFRPDHLGFNGYKRRTAPFLEDLMARSTVFRRAWSTSSWTAPATSSVFTSLYPTRHGVTTGFLVHRRQAESFRRATGHKITLNRLPASMETLPELLHAAGYATYGVATNINIGDEIGFDRGFDRFSRHNGRVAAKVARQLGRWRRRMLASKPYFLYLHFDDVHAPYEPRSPWYEDEGEELARTVSAYDSEISYLDQVLAGLYRDFGWDRSTLLVVVSDHGEELGERGRFGHPFSLFNELLQVLLVFSGEDLGIPGQIADADTSLIDVLPTILDLVGVPRPADRDGSSLAPFLRSEPRAVTSELADRTLFAHRVDPRGSNGPADRQLWAAVHRPWKLIDHPGGRQLFHIERDPGELRNQIRTRPRIAAKLARELATFRAAGGHRPAEAREIELDPEILERLESLGYVQ